MKLGIVGAGKIVCDFLPVCCQIRQSYELAGICATEKELPMLKTLQQHYGIQRIYTDYDQMLNDDFDVIYLGVPNALHYEMAKKALLRKKHVICEKPAVAASWQLSDLLAAADQNGRMIFEAISTEYLSNYQMIREKLKELGPIRIVSMNYSQYSSRYTAFKNGEILPVFSPNACGGALMDLNVYNFHFIEGLFGAPSACRYYPNQQKQIDTSGIAILQYPGFQCALIASKDTDGQNLNMIQGEKGYICMPSSANECRCFDVCLTGQSPQHVNVNPYEHRMIEEFLKIAKIILQDRQQEYAMHCQESLLVSRTMTEARIQAGIRFACDR